MARQVLPWVGAAVGMYFGNPQLGFMIGSMIGNAVDPQVIKGPQLGEGQNNSASEGGYRPIVLGKGAVGVCMIHEGPIKKRTIRTRQSKGGGPVTEEERAYRTMAFALGESAYPDTGVVLLRLWIDNKLRYDVTPTSQIGAESAEFAEEFTFYPGDNDQLPDPDIEAYLGAGNVPSYRGGAPYIVFPDWDVTDSGGRAPMIKAELASAAEGVIGTEWIMTYSSGFGMVFRRSPDGYDWTSSPQPGPLAGDGYYSSGPEILAVNPGNNALTLSEDFGATWTPIGGALAVGTSFGRAAKIGSNWYVADPNTLRYDGTNLTNAGFNSFTVGASNARLFSIQLTSNIVHVRNEAGEILFAPTFRAGGGICAAIWLRHVRRNLVEGLGW